MKQSHFWMGMVILAIAGCGNPSVPAPGKPPVIHDIVAEDTDVRVGANIRLKAQVSSDGNRLTYSWQASNGLISKPNEATTIWISPSTIPITPYAVSIMLTVKDEFGRSDKATYQIQVHQQGLSPL